MARADCFVLEGGSLTDIVLTAPCLPSPAHEECTGFPSSAPVGRLGGCLFGSNPKHRGRLGEPFQPLFHRSETLYGS